jgi:hypothetical protein
MTHKELIESAASYALDALDHDERATFEAHLAGCENASRKSQRIATWRMCSPTRCPCGPFRDPTRCVTESSAGTPGSTDCDRAASDGGGSVAVKPRGRVIPWLAAAAAAVAALVWGDVPRRAPASG